MFFRVKRVNGNDCVYLVENVRESGRHVRRIIRTLNRWDEAEAQGLVEALGLLDQLAVCAALHGRRTVILFAFSTRASSRRRSTRDCRTPPRLSETPLPEPAGTTHRVVISPPHTRNGLKWRNLFFPQVGKLGQTVAAPPNTLCQICHHSAAITRAFPRLSAWLVNRPSRQLRRETHRREPPPPLVPPPASASPRAKPAPDLRLTARPIGRETTRGAKRWRPVRDSNPCCRRERAVS